MPTVTEDTSLESRIEQTTELAPTAKAAAVEAEIKAAITVALRFPRNEDRAFEKLMKACRRTSFAEEANYSFPRGGQDITGPSIHLAREAARVWGNIRHGVAVINDDEDQRKIEAFCWDLETNTKITAEDAFAKLIYRKKGGWQTPDERDLRELTNRRAAILKRNCILEVLPKDLIEDARAMAAQTIKAGVEKDPEAARKRIILKFSSINVSTEMLEEKLGHPLASASADELATLTQVYKSIIDGNSSWAEYVSGRSEKNVPNKPTGPEKGTLSVEDLKPAAEQNRGHGDERLDDVPKKENTAENQILLLCAKKGIPDETLVTKLGQMGIEEKKEIRHKHMKELIEWVTTWQAPIQKPTQKNLVRSDYDDSE